MLLQKKLDGKEKSIISDISDIVEIEMIKEKIKNCFYVPIEQLIKNGTLKVTKDLVTINYNKNLVADRNGNFIWPDDVHVKFKECSWPTIMPSSTSNIYHLTNLDASNMTLAGDFSRINNPIFCRKLEISNWQTSNLKNIDTMFYYFINLDKIDLSTGDLSNVESAKEAFSLTSRLRILKFSEVGLPKLNNTDSMFGKSGSKNGALRLAGLKTGMITNAKEMFKYAGFKEIDIRGWNFSPDCDFNEFANHCSNLEIFNAVQLQEEWLPKGKDGRSKKDAYGTTIGNGTDACVDIIKNPDKYKQYLVK